MAAPANKAYVQGQSTASADNLNSMMQTCDTFAQLRGFIGLPGIDVTANGGGAPNDGLGGVFRWTEGATGPDDGVDVIVPTGAAQGAWVRVTFNVASIISPISSLITSNLTVVLDGNGVTPATGIFRDMRCLYPCSVTDWSIQADQAGDLELDIWVDTFTNNTPPTIANSIVAAAPPTLSAQQQVLSSAVSTWNVSIPAQAAFRFNINSIATITRFTLTLGLRRTV